MTDGFAAGFALGIFTGPLFIVAALLCAHLLEDWLRERRQNRKALEGVRFRKDET